MKKEIKVISAIFSAVLVLLFLMAYGRQSRILSNFEEEISYLETERQTLIHTLNEQTQKIADLQDEIAEFEAQRQTQVAIQDEILDSFMENLAWVAEFLGVDELYIVQEDISLHGNFVTASSDSFGGGGIRLFFRYQTWQEDIRWILLEYVIGSIRGPGFLDSENIMWRWPQESLFDENFIIRFYSYDDIWPEPIGDYTEQEISYYDWQYQVIKHMRAHKDIRIAGLWYEDSRLVVDITPASAVPFNWGSTGGAIRTRSFIDSLASLPNVFEIEVLVGGQRGVSADHFSFAGVFRVN